MFVLHIFLKLRIVHTWYRVAYSCILYEEKIVWYETIYLMAIIMIIHTSDSESLQINELTLRVGELAANIALVECQCELEYSW